MGSFTRVKLHYVDAEDFLKGLKRKDEELPIIATVPEGSNMYLSGIPAQGIILFGNESRGLSENILAYADKKVSIPSWENSGAESLNVGISAAIVCAEYRRSLPYSK